MIPSPSGHSRNFVILGLLSALLGVAMCACGTFSSASSQGLSRQEQQYLQDVHHGATWPGSSNSDSRLVGDGHTICSALTRGDDFNVVENVLHGANLSAKQASALVGSSVNDLCPQFVQPLESWIQQQGSH